MGESAMTELHAVVQAGGLGQRIRDSANELPKPLLAVGGTPMVERLVSQLVDSGVRRITVVIGANGSGIRARITRLLTLLPAPLHLDFHEETRPLGNAGALAEVDSGDADVLLCFADLVTDLDFEKLKAVHVERCCNVTLASHYEHHQLALGELTVQGNEVRGYREKPRKEFLICSGIAVFDARAMKIARALPRPYGLSSLVTATLDAGCRVTHWLHDAYWIDVNTPELLDRARGDEAIRSAMFRRQAG
jgi:NDP-mannose synthase